MILGLLEERRRQYLALTPVDRALVDEMRFVPTLELHDILHHLHLTGAFIDEPPPDTANPVYARGDHPH